jgi:hypothetical protein
VIVLAKLSLHGKKTENDVSHIYFENLKMLRAISVVQSHLQRYVEPSAEPTPVATTLPDALLPLGPGILTNNTSGVPIIVVCTKADHIDDNADVAGGGMVKGKSDEWEERTDGIMQILRTICMKCRSILISFNLFSQS